MEMRTFIDLSVECIWLRDERAWDNPIETFQHAIKKRADFQAQWDDFKMSNRHASGIVEAGNQRAQRKKCLK